MELVLAKNRTEWIILLLPIIVGLGSGWFVSRKKIPKTRYNPPAWVFMTVWPILYFLLGYAGLTVYRAEGFSNWMRQYYFHLAILILWWPIFVYWRTPFSGKLSLLVLIGIALHAIWLINKEPKIIWFMGPYVAWLCVANFLTYQTISW